MDSPELSGIFIVVVIGFVVVNVATVLAFVTLIDKLLVRKE